MLSNMLVVGEAFQEERPVIQERERRGGGKSKLSRLSIYLIMNKVRGFQPSSEFPVKAMRSVVRI